MAAAEEARQAGGEAELEARLIVKGMIDGTSPLPNLIACDAVPRGTVLFVQPGERFEIVDLQGSRREIQCMPRVVLRIDNLELPNEAKGRRE